MPSITSQSAAWAAVCRAEDSGHGSLASDRAGAITGELYETPHETELRERRAERAEALSSRGRTDLNIAVAGTALEISGVCVDMVRPENTRLASAVHGALEELTGRRAPQTTSFDEPDCMMVDRHEMTVDSLAAALVARGYRTAVAGESWGQQIARLASEYDGRFPRGGGSEAERERDLNNRITADFPADGPTRKSPRTT